MKVAMYSRSSTLQKQKNKKKPPSPPESSLARTGAWSCYVMTMPATDVQTTAVCVSLRWSGGLRVVRLPAGSNKEKGGGKKQQRKETGNPTRQQAHPCAGRKWLHSNEETPPKRHSYCVITWPAQERKPIILHWSVCVSHWLPNPFRGSRLVLLVLLLLLLLLVLLLLLCWILRQKEI